MNIEIYKNYCRMSVPLFISLHPPLNCPLWVRFTLSLRLIFQLSWILRSSPCLSSPYLHMIAYDWI